MDWDEPADKPKLVEKRNLDPLSLEELTSYIAELQAEIARAQAAIEAKSRHRAGAEALFRR